MKTTTLSNIANSAQLNGTKVKLFKSGRLRSGIISLGGTTFSGVYVCSDDSRLDGFTIPQEYRHGMMFSWAVSPLDVLHVVNSIRVINEADVDAAVPRIHSLEQTPYTSYGAYLRGEIAAPQAAPQVIQTVVLERGTSDITPSELGIVVSRRLLEMLKTSESISGSNVNLEFYVEDSTVHNDIYVKVLSGEWSIGNYFDVREGSISYCPANRVQVVNSNGTWSRDGRQVIKAGKFIQELIAKRVAYLYAPNRPTIEEVNDETKPIITRFCELKSSQVRVSGQEEQVLVSADPSAIYRMQYAASTGSLASSCMRHDSGHTCRRGASWFTKIGIKVAYMVNATGALTARALLWDDVTTRGGKQIKFMDRIYGAEASIEAMKNWAKANGYYHKAEQSAGCADFISPAGGRSTIGVQANFSVRELNDYSPYMDTMYYLNCETGKMRNYNSDGCIRLQSTAADAFDGRAICPTCGAIHNHSDRIGRGCPVCTICDSITADYISRRDAVRIVTENGVSGMTLPSNIIGWVSVNFRGGMYWAYPQAIMTEEGAMAATSNVAA